MEFKTYQRKVGSVEAAQVTEVTQVVTADGNVTAHPGDYVVRSGSKQIQTAAPDAKGVIVTATKDLPVYDVISAAEFEAEHEV